jgi:hypothetical protein
MNPTLELALTQYAEISPLTIALSVGLALLFVLGAWAFFRGRALDSAGKTLPARAIAGEAGGPFIACLLSSMALLGIYAVQGGNSLNVRLIKEVLSSPSWEFSNPRVEGDTLVGVTLRSIPSQRLEFQLLGQTVAAQPEATEVRVSGPLLQILLQNPEMANALKGQTTIAQAN